MEYWLPRVAGEAWWKECVLYKVSDSQRRHIESLKIDSLSGLDLAALGRILDRNWHDIGYKAGLSHDARHYLKEVLMIRNRWAHAGVDAYPGEDIYRDLDTLVRFLIAFDADDDLVERARSERDAILGKDNSTAPDLPEAPIPSPAPDGDDATSFKIGDMVCTSADHEKYGPVIEVQAGSEQHRYKVFVDKSPSWYYESQLELMEEDSNELTQVNLDTFNALLSARQIQHPGLSTLYSLNAARIDFIPYQFRPVMKFIRADRPRLLIADGVGVGKTIEAGLVLRELQARIDVKSVLIICPKPLVTENKWVNEMRRFDERFTQLDGAALRYCISECDMEGEWPDQHAKTVLPYSLFDDVLIHGTDSNGSTRRKKSQKGLLDLDPPPKFDLVIVDEAHHARNPSTLNYEAVRFFCDNAEAVVFLTATPVQLGSDDLYILLNMLRPDLVIDKKSFEHMAEPNPYINQAIDFVRGGQSGWDVKAVEALERAGNTPWGERILKRNPDFQETVTKFKRSGLSDVDRVKAIPVLEDLHTFSNIINRTRRRDIGEFTVREPKTIEVEFTEEQKVLHDALLEVQEEIYSKIHAGKSINFMMTTIRRQAASCLFGLKPLISDILNRRTEDLYEQEGSDGYAPYAAEVIQVLEEKISGVVELASRLGDEDPKLRALQVVIRQKQALENNKLMVFSSFRHTLSYLYENLVREGMRVGLVHGGVPDADRVNLRRRFQMGPEDSEALDVLLFSEVGCEGLDYQFCDCMVNYDLPWNPMKIEQRIGRIDRNGQRSEKVIIYNFITPGTVDADIYSRCLMRIGIFERSIGAGEEILGSIAKQIKDVAEDLKLTAEERQEKLQQLADNEIRHVQEQQNLEDKQAELFGIRLPADQLQQEIDNASSYWLSVSSLENLVRNYFRQTFKDDNEYLLGEKPIKSLRLSQERRELLLSDYRSLPRIASTANKQWEDWLKGRDQHLQLTFDGATAAEDASVAFINPLHPLVKQAAKFVGNMGAKPIVTLSVVDDTCEPGDYPFAIYEWSYSGVSNDLTLQPIADDPVLAERLPLLLEYARGLEINEDDLPTDNVFNDLDGMHFELWNNAKNRHVDHTERLVSHRRESLDTSHGARVALLEEKISNATNDKIIRMRQAQKNNADMDYKRHLSELKEAASKADITSQPVAFGLIRIIEGSKND
ncbi:helicase [Seongchinamella sediminis]|uniref:Helicase n=1 Tax=Seongchinamella sediminis TaxID=2283635 RepID=A0A3L7DUJ1_9GAMM|nr:helicase [Seongchinamella sediminis]